MSFVGAVRIIFVLNYIVASSWLAQGLRQTQDWAERTKRLRKIEIQRERERKTGMDGEGHEGQGMKMGSRDGKLNHQFFFCIHLDLRDCTVSVSCYFGYLLNV